MLLERGRAVLLGVCCGSFCDFPMQKSYTLNRMVFFLVFARPLARARYARSAAVSWRGMMCVLFCVYH